jgi:hypothetical protein
MHVGLGFSAIGLNRWYTESNQVLGLTWRRLCESSPAHFVAQLKRGSSSRRIPRTVRLKAKV